MNTTLVNVKGHTSFIVQTFFKCTANQYCELKTNERKGVGNFNNSPLSNLWLVL